MERGGSCSPEQAPDPGWFGRDAERRGSATAGVPCGCFTLGSMVTWFSTSGGG